MSLLQQLGRRVFLAKLGQLRDGELIPVEIDGSPLTPDVEAAVTSAVVDDNLHLPDVFQVAFRDPLQLVHRHQAVDVGVEAGEGLVESAREPQVVDDLAVEHLAGDHGLT